MFRNNALVLLLIVVLGSIGLNHLTGRTPPYPSEGKLPVPVQKQLSQPARHGPLLAGVAKVEITNRKVIPVNDPLYVKALVLKSGAATAVIVTVDAVAIGEIGYIGNDYLGKVRGRVEKELGIAPGQIMINASHCHARPCADVAEKTIQAVKEAAENLVPVRVGVGVGFEDRISENRRLRLKNGKEVDVRHAYSLPPDEAIADVGPIDPHIGILRLDGRMVRHWPLFTTSPATRSWGYPMATIRPISLVSHPE